MAAKAAVENARWRGSHASDPNAGGIAPISQGGTRAFTGGPPAATAVPRSASPAGFYPQSAIDLARKGSVFPALNAPANAMEAGNWLVRNFGSGAAASGPPDTSGWKQNVPGGINNLGDIVDAWRRVGSDVTRAFTGGPPASSAAPAVNYPAPPSTAVVPPAVPASPSPLPFSGVQADARIGVPQQQSSLGGYPQVAGLTGSPGTLGRSAPEPSRPYEDFVVPGYGDRSPSSQPPPRFYPTPVPGGGFMFDPQSPAGGRLWGGGRSQQAALGGGPQYAGFNAGSILGDLGLRSTPAYSAKSSSSGLLPGEVPTFNGQPIGGALAGQNLGPIGSAGGPPLVNPGGPIIRSGGEFPASDLNRYLTNASDVLPGGAQFQVGLTPAVLPAAGDPAQPAALDTTATGGVPVRAQGVPYATDPMRRTAGFANIGNGVMQTPAPRPSLGAQVARYAVPAAVGMVGGPAMSLLAGVIARSASRGSLDNAQPYRGTTGGNYATLMTSGGVPALTQWGTQQYSGPAASAIRRSRRQDTPRRASIRPAAESLYAYNPTTLTHMSTPPAASIVQTDGDPPAPPLSAQGRGPRRGGGVRRRVLRGRLTRPPSRQAPARSRRSALSAGAIC